LTLASSVIVDVAGYAVIEAGFSSGDEIVNQGVINVTGRDGDLAIYGGGDFTNEGTINNGALVDFAQSTLTTTALRLPHA
jgi:hypothetical protein